MYKELELDVLVDDMRDPPANFTDQNPRRFLIQAHAAAYRLSVSALCNLLNYSALHCFICIERMLALEGVRALRCSRVGLDIGLSELDCMQ